MRGAEIFRSKPVVEMNVTRASNTVGATCLALMWRSL